MANPAHGYFVHMWTFFSKKQPTSEIAWLKGFEHFKFW